MKEEVVLHQERKTEKGLKTLNKNRAEGWKLICLCLGRFQGNINYLVQIK